MEFAHFFFQVFGPVLSQLHPTCYILLLYSFFHIGAQDIAYSILFSPCFPHNHHLLNRLGLERVHGQKSPSEFPRVRVDLGLASAISTFNHYIALCSFFFFFFWHAYQFIFTCSVLGLTFFIKVKLTCIMLSLLKNWFKSVEIYRTKAFFAH